MRFLLVHASSVRSPAHCERRLYKRSSWCCESYHGAFDRLLTYMSHTPRFDHERVISNTEISPAPMLPPAKKRQHAPIAVFARFVAISCFGAAREKCDTHEADGGSGGGACVLCAGLAYAMPSQRGQCGASDAKKMQMVGPASASALRHSRRGRNTCGALSLLQSHPTIGANAAAERSALFIADQSPRRWMELT